MKCAVYVRVSTDKEEQKQSLSNQKEIFMKLISDRGWDLFDIYLDVQSGTKSKKRPEFKRMIEDAKEKKFDMILAKELSRLARNGQLSYEIKNLAENRGINILTLDGAIDTLSGNTQNFGLFAWVYENESQTTSRRVKETLAIRANIGKFKGSIPPYGYYVENHKLMVKNDFTPDIVRRIFNSYIAGKGFDRIARDLLEKGVPTPSQVAGKSDASSLWHGSSVRKILENPHYTGDLVQQRETTINVTTDQRRLNDLSKQVIIEETHEAIISKGDFKVVQQLMAQRKRKRPYAKKHMFTNIAFCGCCGKSMHYKLNRKGYICGAYNKYGHTKCTDHHVKENVLIEEITQDIREMFSSLKSDTLRKDIESKVAKFLQRDQKRLLKVDGEIEKLKQDKVDALRAKVRKEIENEEYQLLVEDCNSSITKLNEERVILGETLNRQNEALNFKELFEQLKDFINNPILDEKILHKLIDRIEIKEDGSPRIYYRFSNSYISSIFFRATHSTQHDWSTGYRQFKLIRM
jgi:site-specific DNA recombinase